MDHLYNLDLFLKNTVMVYNYLFKKKKNTNPHSFFTFWTTCRCTMYLRGLVFWLVNGFCCSEQMSLDTEPPCKKAKSQVSVDVGSSESKLVMEASVDIEEVCNSSVYTLLIVLFNIFQDNCCYFELPLMIFSIQPLSFRVRVMRTALSNFNMTSISNLALMIWCRCCIWQGSHGSTKLLFNGKPDLHYDIELYYSYWIPKICKERFY